jgi:hypothetical protein
MGIAAIHQLLQDSIQSLLGYCRSEGWAGYDPYDGLNSTVFKKLRFLHSRYPRLVLIQSLKRLPFNLRPLLGVPKAQNPKGIALFVSALTALQRQGLANNVEITELADLLLSLRSRRSQLCSWGYHFDWQQRTALVPVGEPNIICTTFGGNALLDAYDASGEARHREAALEAGRFILEGLNRTTVGDTFCFSYTPLDNGLVHNANLLGAAFLARLFSLTKDSKWSEPAKMAARYSIRSQASDGSWFYGEEPRQEWIDSFHTGYNLLALKALHEHLELPEAAASMRKGFDFYVQHFIRDDGVVKYYHDRTYPIDAHAVAHAMLTLAELRHLDPENVQRAARVFRWSLEHMNSKQGWFFYQKWPLFTNRIPYMRWTQAWMLRAMASLCEAV